MMVSMTIMEMVIMRIVVIMVVVITLVIDGDDSGDGDNEESILLLPIFL